MLVVRRYSWLASVDMHPQLLRKLSKPSRVASILDWKRDLGHTVLALNIHKNRVGIAVASHPSLGMPCLELEPLRFCERKSIARSIDADCLERFAGIVEDYKVCGVVVNWPLQHDTGRMGAACGRVVYALEQLVERSNEVWKNHEGGFLSRPFCLWDAGRIETLQRSDPSKVVDSFGRCASYGRREQQAAFSGDNSNSCTSTSTNNTDYSSNDNSDHLEEAHAKPQNEPTRYFASKEQYYEDELTVVLGVWDDFCREHWPDLCESQTQSGWSSSTSSFSSSIRNEEEPAAQTKNGSMRYRHSGATPVDARLSSLPAAASASGSTSAASAAAAAPLPPSKLRQSIAQAKQKKSLILMRSN